VKGKRRSARSNWFLREIAKVEKSEYVVDVSIDIKVATLYPSEEQEVRLI
jgi:hypothetical protein